MPDDLDAFRRGLFVFVSSPLLNYRVNLRNLLFKMMRIIRHKAIISVLQTQKQN